MKKSWIAVLICSFILITACSSQTKPTSDAPPAVDAGTPEATYQKNCMNCHGMNLQGGVGPDLTKVGSKLGKEDIHKILENGKGRMPAQKSYIKAEDLEKLSTWLSEKK
ncbi:c-type cytochrome [Baia soyae]|uniref:Cytochrome c551 n=1 Tax=Baia soyae TaxID=1544746 RepID=A0A4R2RNV3_9BACL|nr:cytochrome c [Baia soyae]TCP61491.1 cytochrome c551 [Baia soyae]